MKSLRRLAEDRIKSELEAEEGTAAVKVSGGLEDEIQIRVDQQKLSQLGISIGQIADRIRTENVNLSGGRLEEPRRGTSRIATARVSAHGHGLASGSPASVRNQALSSRCWASSALTGIQSASKEKAVAVKLTATNNQ